MVTITGTEGWHVAHPGAIIGLLEISGVDNTAACQALNQRKREVEAQMRITWATFTRKDLLAHPVMAAYNRYYKRFGKTYHVLLQVESILSGAKSLPDVSPLVDANFAAEVATFFLTAGHDADKLVEPVVIDTARQDDIMVMMNSASKHICEHDMVMRDAHGLCCSILYGQDNRSPITKSTQRVLYVTYSPPGLPAEAVDCHMQSILANVRLVSPDAVVEQMALLAA